MATATAPKNDKTEASQALSEIREARLPYHPKIQERFGVDKSSWKALVEAIFPNATSTDSVLLALSYCHARRLDIFKRVVHIVPIWSSILNRMVDSVWPGIGELRTTAFRTGEYAGRDRTLFGPDVSQKVGTQDMTFPEWAEVTVYRMVQGQKVTFVGPKVYWLETYAEKKRGEATPNEMWSTRTRGQLDKCAEAAALRAAFPEEVGSDYIAEEVQHSGRGPAISDGKRTLDTVADQLDPPPQPKPGQQEPQPTLDEQFAAFQSELLATGANQDERQGVWDKWFGKDSSIEWPNEYHAKADEMFQQPAPAKGGKKSQGKLLETGATAQSSGT